MQIRQNVRWIARHLERVTLYVHVDVHVHGWET